MSPARRGPRHTRASPRPRGAAGTSTAAAAPAACVLQPLSAPPSATGQRMEPPVRVAPAAGRSASAGTPRGRSRSPVRAPQHVEVRAEPAEAQRAAARASGQPARARSLRRAPFGRQGGRALACRPDLRGRPAAQLVRDGAAKPPRVRATGAGLPAKCARSDSGTSMPDQARPRTVSPAVTEKVSPAARGKRVARGGRSPCARPRPAEACSVSAVQEIVHVPVGESTPGARRTRASPAQRRAARLGDVDVHDQQPITQIRACLHGGQDGRRSLLCAVDHGGAFSVRPRATDARTLTDATRACTWKRASLHRTADDPLRFLLDVTVQGEGPAAVRACGRSIGLAETPWRRCGIRATCPWQLFASCSIGLEFHTLQVRARHGMRSTWSRPIRIEQTARRASLHVGVSPHPLPSPSSVMRAGSRSRAPRA